MRALILVTIVTALGGCASHHIPKSAIPARPTSSDWSAVRALPRTTFVLLTLDDEPAVHRAYVHSVSDATLTIYEFDRSTVTTIPRERVAAISIRDRIGTKRAPRYISIPIASAIVGGLGGLIVGAVARDRDVAQKAAWTFGIGMMVGMAAGPMDYPRSVILERPVYVRP